MLELLAPNSTMQIHQLLSVKRRKSVRIRMDSVVLVLGLALQESAALKRAGVVLQWITAILPAANINMALVVLRIKHRLAQTPQLSRALPLDRWPTEELVFIIVLPQVR